MEKNKAGIWMLEPKVLTYRKLLFNPVKFLIFIILVTIGTNMMPFYSDGSRMNLVDGITTLANGIGEVTIPYNIPKNGAAYTDRTLNWEPIEYNSLSSIPYYIATLLKVDVYTGIILFISLLSMLYTLCSSVIEVRFSKVEQELCKMAYDSTKSNDELKKGFKKLNSPAYLFSIILSVLFTLIVPQVVFNIGNEGLGLITTPVILIFIPIIFSKALKCSSSASGLLANYVSRRCSECNFMDSYFIASKKYVSTKTTTTSRYKQNRDGSNKQYIGGETKKHDIHDYIFECKNCGDRFELQA